MGVALIRVWLEICQGHSKPLAGMRGRGGGGNSKMNWGKQIRMFSKRLSICTTVMLLPKTWISPPLCTNKMTLPKKWISLSLPLHQYDAALPKRWISPPSAPLWCPYPRHESLSSLYHCDASTQDSNLPPPVVSLRCPYPSNKVISPPSRCNTVNIPHPFSPVMLLLKTWISLPIPFRPPLSLVFYCACPLQDMDSPPPPCTTVMALPKTWISLTLYTNLMLFP